MLKVFCANLKTAPISVNSSKRVESPSKQTNLSSLQETRLQTRNKQHRGFSIWIKKKNLQNYKFWPAFTLNLEFSKSQRKLNPKAKSKLVTIHIWWWEFYSHSVFLLVFISIFVTYLIFYLHNIFICSVCFKLVTAGWGADTLVAASPAFFHPQQKISSMEVLSRWDYIEEPIYVLQKLYVLRHF